MANSFKSDDSFLRKLIVGAAGTNSTIDSLKAMGFNPIELERGSTGFKIWKRIKIKRVRVPDIMCLDTGLRFESRGKTCVEISMSHSLSNPGRAWDVNMKDNDYVSIVVFDQDDSCPVNITQLSPVHYISVKDLREAFPDRVDITHPKGVEEGSEIRVVWVCASARSQSIVASIDENRIFLEPTDGGKRQTIFLNRKKKSLLLQSQVAELDTVDAYQIVASVVPVYTQIARPALIDEKFFVNRLTSINLSERYAAAKALRYRGFKTAETALADRMNDAGEDIYVQLEAAAALAAHDHDEGWDFLRGKLNSSSVVVPLETQLETIIVASEICHSKSEELLICVLRDPCRDEELRAGAAWGLGQFSSAQSAEALVDTFNATSLEIKIEAARALLRIADPQIDYLTQLIKSSPSSARDGLSWVLARTSSFDPSSVLAEADDDLRRWISYIIGYGRNNIDPSHVEQICKADPEVYFAGSVLWQLLDSWISTLREY